MYFKLACPNCGKNLKVSEEHVGRKARCPYCHTQVIVPEPPKEDVPLDMGAIDAGALEASGPSVPGGPSFPGLGAPPKPPEQAAAAQGSAKEQESPTDVHLLKAGLIGFGMLVLIYLILFPFPEKAYLRSLFYDRSPVQYASTFLACYSWAILFLKWRKLRRQRDSMLFDVLPTELGEEITSDNIEKFTAHVRGLPGDASQSFLVNRVLRGLQHFRIRKSVSEVSSMMSSQSDIDANAVASSYTILSVFVWAIPILGFIGTVMGIGSAINQFSNVLAQAAEISELKESLKDVMIGMATAFDTTLLALVLSIFVIFPTKTLQKAEDDLLNWVAEYCNENLLKRLQEDDGSASVAGPEAELRRHIRQALSAAMATHHAEFQQWTEKLEKIGVALTTQAAKGFNEIHRQLAEEHKTKETQFRETVTGVTDKQRSLLEAVGEVESKMVQKIRLGEAEELKTAQAMQEAAMAMRDYMTGMQAGLTSLNEVLLQLGEKQIVIETHVAPRRGWFGFGRKNGG